MRQVVYLLAPVKPGSQDIGPAGIASLAEELQGPVKDLIGSRKPPEFFRPALLEQLDTLIRKSVSRPLAPGCEPRLRVYYAALWNFRPYQGQGVEWIERLDESVETAPHALALLARHSGGVFVVRHSGSIVAYIGLRAYSQGVWELTEPRLTASVHASSIARPEELFAALIARATRAAFEADRIPICTLSSRAQTLRRALVARGYRHYAHSSVYATIVS